MVILDSVLLVADHKYEHSIQITLDSINRKSTRVTKIMDGSTKTNRILIPIRIYWILNSWNGTKRSNTFQTGMVLVRLLYLVSSTRELRLQVVQHLYSTSLVVLKRDTLLRLQKEQFYSISLVWSHRENNKRLCWIWFYYSQEELELPLTQEVSSYFSCWYSTFWCWSARCIQFRSTRRNLPTHFGGGYTDLSWICCTIFQEGNFMRLSGELTHPDIDYTPHYGIDRNIGIETGLTISPGSSGGEYGDPGIVTTRFIPKYIC